MKKKYLIAILLLIFSNQVSAMDSSSVVQILNGTKIHAVSPASGTTKEGIEKLKSIKGLNIIVPDCFDGSSPYHAASEEKRFQCLKNAIYDESTDVIWCMRGGYGSSKIISELRKLPKPKKEKMFIGYSDITALHLFFSQEWGWQPIHAAIMLELLKDEKETSSMNRLAKLISSKKRQAKIEGLVPMNGLARNSEEITGLVTGGNLTMVQTSLGTDWAIKSNGKILFFEDTGMKPYQTDRSLTHLKQAGAFNGVKAIIFGAFDKDDPETINGLQLFAKEIKIPVFKTNRFGHEKFNDPIIYNLSSSIAPSSKKGEYSLIMKGDERYAQD